MILVNILKGNQSFFCSANQGIKFCELLRFLSFLMLLLPFAAIGQGKAVHQQQVWMGYYHTLSVGKRLSVVGDVQVRTKDWLAQWSQQLLRGGLSYQFNKQVAATAGAAFFRTAQYVNGLPLFKKEYRPWQEVSFKQDQKNFNLAQRLRMEQRIMQQVKEEKLVKDYHFLFRLRYKADVQWPLGKANFSVGIGNEIMVNPSHIGKAGFFDQNRASASLFCKVAPGATLQLQYIKIIQKKLSMNVWENVDVVRLNVHHQLKWQNK